MIALVVASLTGLLPVQVMRVASSSMAPTIAGGDLVLVEHGAGPVGRGDIVAVEAPAGGGLLVKRAVAVGGDVVAIEDGLLLVDGSLVCEPQIDQSRSDGVYFGPVTVPAGELFLLGDNRGNSIDSRVFGPVPAGDVVGLVRTRLWSAPGSLRTAGC